MGVILLSGCATTNEFLEKDGNEGNRDTLPVKLETLIEMAEHCKEVYEEGEELEEARARDWPEGGAVAAEYERAA